MMNATFREATSSRLREARSQAGFSSAADAARVLGVKEVTYRAWENGQNCLPKARISSLCATFRVSVDWLLTGEQDILNPATADSDEAAALALGVLLRNQGWSQAKLAAHLGIHQTSVSRMVTGDRRISRLEAIALQKLLLSVTSAAETQPRSDLREERAFAFPSDSRGRDVVVSSQDEIEVYEGGTSGVVIRAIDSSPGGEDQTIVIRPENVDAVVAALLRVKAEALR